MRGDKNQGWHRGLLVLSMVEEIVGGGNDHERYMVGLLSSEEWTPITAKNGQKGLEMRITFP